MSTAMGPEALLTVPAATRTLALCVRWVHGEDNLTANLRELLAGGPRLKGVPPQA